MEEQKATDVSVDRLKLPEQLEQLPTDILIWSRVVAEGAEAVQRAENALKLTEAQLSIDIRQNPINYGFTKTTEDLIKSCVQMQQSYVDAQNAVLVAKTELAQSRAVLDALECKRSSLKYISELTVAGYLGSTTIQPKGVKN